MGRPRLGLAPPIVGGTGQGVGSGLKIAAVADQPERFDGQQRAPLIVVRGIATDADGAQQATFCIAQKNAARRPESPRHR